MKMDEGDMDTGRRWGDMWKKQVREKSGMKKEVERQDIILEMDKFAVACSTSQWWRILFLNNLNYNANLKSFKVQQSTSAVGQVCRCCLRRTTNKPYRQSDCSLSHDLFNKCISTGLLVHKQDWEMWQIPNRSFSFAASFAISFSPTDLFSTLVFITVL